MADDFPDDTGDKQVATQFKPGQSGNPNGRPKGSRNRLSQAFFDALEDSFDREGEAVIDRLIKEDPKTYCKIIAQLCPAKLEAKVDVNLGIGDFGDTNSISDVLEMVAKEAGHEAAVTLATMFGIKNEHYPQILLPPEPIEAEVCPHAAGSDSAKAWHKRRGVG
jgi:hypothetical protein